MSEIDFQTLGNILISVLCFISAVFIFAVVYILYIFFKNRQYADLGEKFVLTSVPIAWVIPSLVGLIYVESHTQIGVVGKKVFLNSGLFVDNPLAPARKVLISKQRVSRTATAKNQTQDNVEITVEITAECQVIPHQAGNLVSEHHNPLEYLDSKLRAILKNYIRATPYEQIHPEERGQQRISLALLESEYQENFDYFDIRVTSMSDEGNVTGLKDKIALIKEIIRIKMLELEIELQADLSKQLMTTMVQALLAEGLTSEQDITQAVQKMLQIVQQKGPAYFLGQYSRSAQPDPVLPPPPPLTEFEKTVARSAFQLVYDNHPEYEIAYRRYRVQIVVQEKEQEKTLYKLKVTSPVGEEVVPERTTKMELKALLEKLQEGVDDHILKNKS